MAPGMRDSKVDKWRSWLDHNGKIQNQVLVMHLHRFVWQEYARMLREHGSLPNSYWWEFARETYVASQAVAVRRQADTDPRVISLSRLLTELAKDAPRVTRAVIAGIWKPEDAFGERDVDRIYGEFAGSVGVHVDPAIPLRDLESLRAGAAKVNAYVDRHLAHLDAKPIPPTDLPSLDDLHDAIDVIGNLFKRYHLLFTAADMPFLVPVLQHDWLAPFRQPWIPTGAQFFARSGWE